MYMYMYMIIVILIENYGMRGRERGCLEVVHVCVSTHFLLFKMHVHVQCGFNKVSCT